MKSTARAHSNIALVKYWGKGDEELRLPVNSSLAITLDKIFTETTVEFSNSLKKDEVTMDGDTFNEQETERVSRHLDLIRQRANLTARAKVVTKNNFPKGVGAASSASGFAALSVAAAAATGLKLSEKELSVLARQGSGSASRSIPGGITVWHKGDSSHTSFAEKIEYPSEWNLKVLLVFVGDLHQKKVGSTEGMAIAQTSPYYQIAIQEAEENIERMKKTFKKKDWLKCGEIIEAETFRLHMLCMTSIPHLLYWRGTTVDVFQKLIALREENIYGFFTVDAGPHVHVVCQEKDVKKITSELQAIEGITDIVECGIGGPAKLIDSHLF
ncbi:MAG TPA: diphosphomevalonate decarboxylase [Patescibacteria group bacterium]